jgi:histone H3/H4
VAETWLKCTACKNPIPFNETHWVCSVSTCNRPKFPMVFCTVSCWDSHVADARHRDAWAVEARAPSKAAWEQDHAAHPAPPPPSAPAAPVVRRVVGDSPSAPVAVATGSPGTVHLQEVVDNEILIVVSKMKKYIKDRSGMNCSDSVADMISEHVRAVCDEAIRSAARNERKTVLDRDVPKARR